MNKTTVRLIAPSGYPHDRDAMTRGVERLRDAGCEVEGMAVLDRREQRYAGSDAQRAADINALADMASLPDVVLAVRGGYGATRLLEHLHYDALRERLTHAPTVLVGHSDFTAVQLALYTKSALCTFAGPMLGPDFGAPDLCAFTWNHFWTTVGATHSSAIWKTGNAAPELDVEGPLWGGNLAVLCSLIGTPYFPGADGRGIDGGILFVEDVGEPPFRIERLLYQLHLSGVLGRQRALRAGRLRPARAGAGQLYALRAGRLRQRLRHRRGLCADSQRYQGAGDRRHADGPRRGEIQPALRRAGPPAGNDRPGAAGFFRLSALRQPGAGRAGRKHVK
jgi:muramoyltetrapeptide carboxypeptidase